MAKFATEGEAYDIGSIGYGIIKIDPNTNKYCTKTNARNLGCLVDGDYEDNQLVHLADLEHQSYRYSLRNISTYYFTNIIVRFGSVSFEGSLPAGGVLYYTGNSTIGSSSATVMSFTETTGTVTRSMIHVSQDPDFTSDYLLDVY